MKTEKRLSTMICALSVVFSVASLNAAAAREENEQPWQKLYVGDEATGQSVIALWQFLPGQEAKDNSGHGHDLTLRGEARYAQQGRFGSCLESFPADQDSDKPQGAMAKNHPSLTPAGAFTLETWFKPKPEMDKFDTVFLLDKKYFHYAKDLPEANRDYCLFMRRTGENRRRIVAFLGYGKDSAAYTSDVVELEPGTWYHVAFAYDGAGTGRFFFNGKSAGRTAHEGRGAVTAGTYHLAIGDRYGSIHAGFPGFIDQVRISNGIVPFFSGGLEVEVSGARTAFVRGEENARVAVTVVNDTGKPLTDVRATVALAGSEREFLLPDFPPRETRTIEVPVETVLRPDRYAMEIAVAATGGQKKYQARESFPVALVPRPLPHTMPVVMWGGGDFETLKRIGFTHQLIHLVDYAKVWAAGQPTEAMTSGSLAESAQSLNEHLAQGIGGVVYVYPAHWVMGNEQLKQRYQRIDRSGKPYSRENACALFPELGTFAYNVGASVAKSFGHFPALQGSLIHSEIRDGTNLCFHQHDQEAFRKFAGYDIPAEAAGNAGVHYSKIENFPENRLVPDDDRILIFYRWFWKEGDGWNGLHTRVHQGLKSTGRDDLWTFFDPAVRVPSVWGSGGDVDVISQWTYSYPDPIKIGQATDELFAMAAGAPHGQKEAAEKRGQTPSTRKGSDPSFQQTQQVMKMTQVIWYRSQTAPEVPKDQSQRAPWEVEIPDARFITIAPDHMREAFWSKISRPIRGIMYHGWASLVPGQQGAYRFTNAKTSEVLTELVRDVVQPLGPALLQVPDRESDVALLESFASQVFAGRGTRGWGGTWEADVHLILQWAQIQPRIIYDETVLRDGLDDFRVLVMPSCDVLTESVGRKVAEFQKKGGIIVADENLAPALDADILIPSCRRTGKADEDKAALQAKAAALRQELDSRYRRYGDSSNPDVVVRVRQYGSTDYLFAVNDKRTFGDYVGHHGKVMEQGLPNSATLTVKRKSGYVYDLVAHKPIPAVVADDGLRFDATFGPGDGRVWMIAEKQIAGVRIDGPLQAQLGKQVELNLSVVDDGDHPVDAVIPVQVEILDPENRPAEFSGYYGARDGKLGITADLAPNDLAGQWTIRVTELASGLRRERTLTVSR